MLDELKDFDGKMSENSIKATVYSFWHYFFYRSLLKDYTTMGNTEYAKSSFEMKDGKMQMQPFWSDNRRLLLVDNYAFTDMFQRLIRSISEEKGAEKFNRICQGAYNDNYKGKDVCAHNIARALFDAMLHLNKTVSQDK